MTCLEIEALAKKQGTELPYKAKEADDFLATPVAAGCIRWRCVLCGCPQGDFEASRDDIGAYCCGGCGMTCVRPIDEQVKQGNGEKHDSTSDYEARDVPV